MVNIRVSQGIRKLADSFKDLFDDKYNNLCALFTLFLFDFINLSTLCRSCPWTHSISELSREVQGFNGNRFMRRLQKSILRRYGGKINREDFCYAIDDTDNPKYGKFIYRNGKWRGSKGTYFGQKILVIALIDMKRGIAIPLAYDFVIKKEDPEYKSTFKLAISLLDQLFKNGFPKLAMVADSWFFASDFAAELKKIDIDLIGELKSNRLCKRTPAPNARWMKLEEIFNGIKKKIFGRKNKGHKWYQEIRLHLKKYKSELKVIAVFNNKRDKIPFAYYASTDSTLSGARIWKLYKARWKIECLFRDLKQWLSFGRLPCKGKNAADLAVCLPFALIVSLRLDFPKDWGLDKKNSIGKMISIIREDSMDKTISYLIGTGESKLTKVLKARKSRARVNQKCVNTIAEKNKKGKTSMKRQI